MARDAVQAGEDARRVAVTALAAEQKEAATRAARAAAESQAASKRPPRRKRPGPTKHRRQTEATLDATAPPRGPRGAAEPSAADA
jgi:hypothetical protein